MAQTKKRSPRAAAVAAEAQARDASEAKKAARRAKYRHLEEHAGPFRIGDYIKINVVFYAFCIVQLIIVRVLLPDFAGLYFFFGFLMCAFLIASVFDYLAEKFNMGLAAGDTTELTND